jgi:outer membrane protein
MIKRNLHGKTSLKIIAHLFLVGLSIAGSFALAQQGPASSADRGSIGQSSFLQSTVRSIDASSPGIFSGISLTVTDKLSIESYFRGSSTLSVGAIGSAPRVQSYSLAGQTLMGQYRFGDDQSSFRPRLGAGLAYNIGTDDQGLGIPAALHGDLFNSERGLNNRGVNGLGLALEVGASYALSKSWYLEGSVMKSYIRSSGTTLSAGATTGLPGLKIDPLKFSFSVGFKFD